MSGREEDKGECGWVREGKRRDTEREWSILKP